MFEILVTVGVILLVVAYFGFLIGRYIYKRVHHIPTGDCASCYGKKNSLVKMYHKKYSKK